MTDEQTDEQTDEANSISPLRLEKTEARELLIEWSDGRTDRIPFLRLRKGCQCAHCIDDRIKDCLLYTSPSPRDATLSRMPSSA